MAHIGGIVSRGPGMTIIEATAVTPVSSGDRTSRINGGSQANDYEGR
jgi:hypothetical protein